MVNDNVYFTKKKLPTKKTLYFYLTNQFVLLTGLIIVGSSVDCDFLEEPWYEKNIPSHADRFDLDDNIVLVVNVFFQSNLFFQQNLFNLIDKSNEVVYKKLC